MYIDQFMRQVEPYSDTAVGEAALHKTLEQFGTLFFGYANSVIYYLDAELLLVFQNVYFEYNLSVRRRVLESVGQQIIGNLV